MKVVLLGTLYTTIKHFINILNLICFYQQDVASLQLDDDDDDDDSDGIVPQRRNQLSQEHEDLVAKGEAFFNVHIFTCFAHMNSNCNKGRRREKTV